MIKLPNARFDKEILLLIFCVLGTLAVAWWAWAAGPVQPKSALGSAAPVETAQGLTGPAYGSQSPGSGATSSDQAVGSSGSASSGNASSPASPPVNVMPQPDPLYPIDPSPKCPYYKYPGNIQPMLYCPICETYQTSEGIRYPCGCGGRGTELLCASPL